jgi:hypothetical protein
MHRRGFRCGWSAFVLEDVMIAFAAIHFFVDGRDYAYRNWNLKLAPPAETADG